MLKDFAWKAFEKTGSVEGYMLYREIQLGNNVLTEINVVEDEVAISTSLLQKAL
ncbi:MAG: YqzL family protein [Clostridia bacterium]|nr:YqzL family protein [Clostridia bacterium]